MKKWFKWLSVGLVLVLLVPLFLVTDIFALPGTPPPGEAQDITGTYTLNCNMSFTTMNGTKLLQEGGKKYTCKTWELYLVSQNGTAITDAYLESTYLLEDNEYGYMNLQGEVGQYMKGTRLYLYTVPPTEPAGDNFVVVLTATVLFNRDSSVRSLTAGKINGIDLNDMVSRDAVQLNGTFRNARWQLYQPN